MSAKHKISLVFQGQAFSIDAQEKRLLTTVFKQAVRQRLSRWNLQHELNLTGTITSTFVNCVDHVKFITIMLHDPENYKIMEVSLHNWRWI